MIDAIQDAMEYFDQRADVQGDNPSAPNEEMCLWEELNQAAKEIAELEARAEALEKESDVFTAKLEQMTDRRDHVLAK